MTLIEELDIWLTKRVGAYESSPFSIRKEGVEEHLFVDMTKIIRIYQKNKNDRILGNITFKVLFDYFTEYITTTLRIYNIKEFYYFIEYNGSGREDLYRYKYDKKEHSFKWIG